MDYQYVMYAVIAMAGLGLVLGAVLSAAAKKFHVKVDEKVQYIWDILPGANCGACGFPSCEAAAEGIAKGEISFDSCRAGGHEVAERIADILGEEAGEKREPEVAIANCGGGSGKVNMRYEYEGVESCHAAQIVASGPLACNYGCLGFSDCVRACPFDAISLRDDNLPEVDPAKCTACGICVEACPRGIMTLVSKSSQIAVLCNSKDKGKVVRKACKVGCIACVACEKICPTDPKAITVQENLAILDYSLCINCFKCVDKCPTKCIVKVSGGVIVFSEPAKEEVQA